MDEHTMVIVVNAILTLIVYTLGWYVGYWHGMKAPNHVRTVEISAGCTLPMRYGKTIAWHTPFHMGCCTVSYMDCATREEAHRLAIEAAINEGWTPPRWWQWWRWGEAWWKWDGVDKQLAHAMAAAHLGATKKGNTHGR
jgi:hypothetical protein